MMIACENRSDVYKFLIFFFVIGIFAIAGCGGGGGTSTGGGTFDGDLFDGACEISEPDFPFCGQNPVRCSNGDQTLYQIFDQTCPSGWSVVPDDVAFPGLACTSPEGQTFNVDADQCPPGWTEFTLFENDCSFTFCDGNLVRCRNEDQTLYQVFNEVCPTGWSLVPDEVPFPTLACTNPEGQTFNVDAAQCPPGWTEFTVTL